MPQIALHFNVDSQFVGCTIPEKGHSFSESNDNDRMDKYELERPDQVTKEERFGRLLIPAYSKS
jgi:hypothetical protein